MSKLLFGTAKINPKGHLTIGGCDMLELVHQFGTPLYVYDVSLIKERMQGFKQTFEALEVKHGVTYASKAFTCQAMYQLVKQAGLYCDVVSGGELYAALKAGMKPEKITFHGNNKTPAELAYAVEVGVGMIILDNFYELACLQRILKEKDQKQAVLIRVAPGIDAYTHKFIMTGQEDSKFGFDVKSEQASRALEQVLADSHLELKGLHCHIGSQIFDTLGFQAASDRMMEIMLDFRERYNYVAEILNLGGGFGVTYTQEDNPLSPEEYVKDITKIVKQVCQRETYPVPEIWIEPGRSIVAEAGTALYTIGSIKDIPSIRKYVSIDGGMGDNIRPALYQAKYTGYLANRMFDESEEIVTIAGKYCETGDQLIDELHLPKVVPGDVLAIPSVGAYGYSMASNYNKNPRPAVVFVEDGKGQLVIKRETFADMSQLDIPLPPSF